MDALPATINEERRPLFPFHLHLVTENDLMGKIHQCLQSENAGIWQRVAASCDWNQEHPSLLRAIVLKVYNHSYGHIIIYKILPLNVMHFEDFEIMARDWKNANFYLTESIIFKALEVGRYCNCVKQSRNIASAIGNGGPFSWEAMKRYDHE